MSLIQTIFWLVLAIALLIGVPIVLVWTMVDSFRGKGSDRRGGGGLTSGVGAAMQELDRLMARPSIEHTLETEHQIHKREDDSGGDLPNK